jgi:tetratricopeptide (TPR) repeat protein
MNATTDPRIAEAFQRLREGRLDDAERLCRAALAGGGGAPAHVALARVYLAAGRPAAARAEATQAVALDPGQPECQMALGDAEHADGDFAAALARWRQLDAALPGQPRILLGLARAAQRHGERDLALAAYGALLERDPRHPLALRGLVHLRLDADDRQGAIDAARRLLAVQPDAVDAWYSIALAHWQEHDLAPAMAALHEVLRRDPNHLPARWAVANLPADTLHADDAAMRAWVERYLQALAAFEALGDPPPQAHAAVAAAFSLCNNFYVHYALEDTLPIQRRAGALLARLVDAIDGPAAVPPRPPRARPRVLFASSFLYQHSVGKLFERVLTGLDRTTLEVRVLACGTSADALTARIAAGADALLRVRRDPAAIRRCILDEAPDVLVWLDIGMDPMLAWVATQRLAPVQCALWGHPVTTGFARIDWFLTADAMERPGGEADYGERVFRLPGLGCRFAAPAEAPPPPRGADADAPPVYGLPQMIFKLTPVHDGVLARIAAALPGARFDLVPGASAQSRGRLHARIERAFAAAGLSTQGRVTMHPGLDRAQWFALLGGLDVNLDPIGWSGGVTSLEMLWFEIPTVTLPGRSMRSRHALGMLRLLELDRRLVARDLDDYLRIAVELGRSADLRAELRGLIGERKHRLYDDPAVSAALQSFLLDVAAGRDPGKPG